MNAGADRPRPAVDPRHGSSGPDQREIHRQQRLEPGSFKLKKKRVRNSPDMWIRADGAFEPIVDRALFEAAQAIIRERSPADQRRDAAVAAAAAQDAVISPAWSSTKPSSCHRAAPIRAGSAACCAPTSWSVSRRIATTAILRSIEPSPHASRRSSPETIAGIEKRGGPVKQDPATDLLTDKWRIHGVHRNRAMQDTARVRCVGISASTRACGRTSPSRSGWTSKTDNRSTIISCLAST